LNEQTSADTFLESQKRWEQTIEGFGAFTSSLPAGKEKGIVYGTGAWNVGDILRTHAVDEAYEVGKRL
jgi:hypothetical protein